MVQLLSNAQKILIFTSIKMLFLVLLVIFNAHQAVGQKKEEKKTPYNVLFIIVDDLKPALGCYGNTAVKSPNIDKLAAGATVFSNAYANVPVCGASRASFLSGKRPLWPHRFTSFNSYADKDCPEAITVPEHFKNNNYHTVSNGKVFHNLNDSEGAWSEPPWRSLKDYTGKWADFNVNKLWLDPASANLINTKNGRGPYYEFAAVPDTAYNDGKLAKKTIADLERLKANGQPFFLASGFWKPHLPYVAPAKYWDMYDHKKLALADNQYLPENLPRQCSGSNEIKSYGNLGTFNSEAFHRNTRHAYYACVSYIDAQIGKVMDELERLELVENTVVVLMGDHGYNLGEHTFWGKHNLLDNSLRTPLIIKVPGKQGQVVDDVVELVDIYPTICRIAGLPLPEGLAGKDLFEKPSDTAEQQYAAFAQWKKGKAVINKNYSYTEWRKGGELLDIMLFDQLNDPEQNKNVANDPDYASVVVDHRNHLQKHNTSETKKQ